MKSTSVEEAVSPGCGWERLPGFRAVEERRVAWTSVIAIEDGTIVFDD
jgi:hypothetical protein